MAISVSVAIVLRPAVLRLLHCHGVETALIVMQSLLHLIPDPPRQELARCILYLQYVVDELVVQPVEHLRLQYGTEVAEVHDAVAVWVHVSSDSDLYVPCVSVHFAALAMLPSRALKLVSCFERDPLRQVHCLPPDCSVDMWQPASRGSCSAPRLGARTLSSLAATCPVRTTPVCAALPCNAHTGNMIFYRAEYPLTRLRSTCLPSRLRRGTNFVAPVLMSISFLIDGSSLTATCRMAPISSSVLNPSLPGKTPHASTKSRTRNSAFCARLRTSKRISLPA